MKRERLEDLLRTKPPDEPPYGDRVILDAVATDAVRSGPGRRSTRGLAPLPTAALVVITLGVIIGSLVIRSSAGPSPSPSPSTVVPTLAFGVIPWIDASPSPASTPEATPDPMSLPACKVGDLAIVAGGWSGATGSLEGGADLVNVSANPCRVAGRPAAELVDAAGVVITQSPAADAGTRADVVALPLGGVVSTSVAWGNWCLAPPPAPLHLRLTLPGAGDQLAATVRTRGTNPSVPRCDSPDSPSSLGVLGPFTAPAPSSGGYEPVVCTTDQLVAFTTDWGVGLGSSYSSLVVLNDGGTTGVDCLLPTEPDLELRDANGRRIAVATGDPGLPATVLLPIGWAAIGTLAFADWCSALPALPLQADVLIGTTRLMVQARGPIGLPGCSSGLETPPPTLAYDAPLSVPGSPGPPEPDPIDTLPVSVTLAALPATQPGDTLDYAVTLTNVSAYDKPLNIAFLCPNYTERLILPNGSTIESRHALNCAPAGWLTSGAQQTFEMRLAIPADSPTGTATLVWILGDRGSAAKTTFKIGP